MVVVKSPLDGTKLRQFASAPPLRSFLDASGPWHVLYMHQAGS